MSSVRATLEGGTAEGFRREGRAGGSWTKALELTDDRATVGSWCGSADPRLRGDAKEMETREQGEPEMGEPHVVKSTPIRCPVCGEGKLRIVFTEKRKGPLGNDVQHCRSACPVHGEFGEEFAYAKMYLECVPAHGPAKDGGA